MYKQITQPHGRILIRQRVKQLLAETVDIDKKKMFFDRPSPKFEEELPCLLAYFSDEVSDTQNIIPRNYERNLSLVVEIQIKTDATIETFTDGTGKLNRNYEDDFLDSRAYEIERALGKDKYLGLDTIVSDVVMLREQPVTIEYEGDTTVYCLRTFWNICWRDAIFDDSNLDEFLKFNTDYNLDNNAKASDNIIIREE